MTEPKPTKRERTRRKLIDAGLQVIADRGEALTAADVVTAADVSNGTFYNHFLDRDDFIQTLAHESLKAITEGSADDTEGADPAWRFAVATSRVLDAAIRQPLWGRAVLRLAGCPTPLHAAVQQHLRADLAEGQRIGRFTHGDDPITVDLVSGTVMASVRRLVSIDTPVTDADRDAIPDVVARLLEAIGVERDEACSLAAAAHHAERTPPERLETQVSRIARLPR
jgi:AcrR family transcriptional regulator